MTRCFACDRPLGKTAQTVYTADGQAPYVGIECYRLIQRAGEEGYQPPMGGPRLYWTLRSIYEGRCAACHCVHSDTLHCDGSSAL